MAENFSGNSAILHLIDDLVSIDNLSCGDDELRHVSLVLFFIHLLEESESCDLGISNSSYEVHEDPLFIHNPKFLRLLCEDLVAWKVLQTLLNDRLSFGL